MPYRNPDQTRILVQFTTVQQYAGHAAIWRQYVSASAGVNVMGMGTALYYREQAITALFAPLPPNPETQTPAGMIAGDEFQMTSTQQVGRQDEVRWKGELYRVESDPSPATMPGYWVSRVKRGFSGT
jgi:hypothetical protein